MISPISSLPFKAVAISAGYYLPEKIVTNDDIQQMGVDTNHDWIVKRTGIHQRHFAANDELTSDLGVKAAQQALKKANLNNNDIDLIILATTTADHTFPATATKIQHKLNITHGAAFDVQSVCSGFVYALSTACNLLRIGAHKRALVIGAEIYSRILDFNDRSSCILFGDGAGALIIEAKENINQQNTNPKNTDQSQFYQQSGIYGEILQSDGRYYDSLYVNGGIATTQQAGVVVMKGQEVYRHAVTKMGGIITQIIDQSPFSIDDVDWFIPHQANARIIEKIAEDLAIPSKKVVITVQEHANTSAATIPIALAKAIDDGRIKKQDIIAITALGGGFSWGAGLLRW